MHQVAKALGLQLQHQSFQYSGLISFRIDWFDHLAIQQTLKSLLQHHSLKALILQHLAFFMVQHSHPYIKRVLSHTDTPILDFQPSELGKKEISVVDNLLSLWYVDFYSYSSMI